MDKVFGSNLIIATTVGIVTTITAALIQRCLPLDGFWKDDFWSAIVFFPWQVFILFSLAARADSRILVRILLSLMGIMLSVAIVTERILFYGFYFLSEFLHRFSCVFTFALADLPWYVLVLGILIIDVPSGSRLKSFVGGLIASLAGILVYTLFFSCTFPR